MTINKYIPPISVVQEYKVPTVEQIKNGTKLPDNYVTELRNPNVKFPSEVGVYCSYSGCPHSTPFEIEIYLQNFGNSRRWARDSAVGLSLPGYWKESPTGQYRWREDLWLNHIGHGHDALPLLINNKVYTVGYLGQYCQENTNFRNRAIEIIRDCMEEHKEKGAAINVKETIDSEVYKWNKFLIKTGIAVGASAINPANAIVIGAATWGAGKVGQELCDSDRGKDFWNTVGSIGGDTAKGAIGGEIIGGLVGGVASSSLVSRTTEGGEIVKGIHKIYEGVNDYVKPTWQAGWHVDHIDRGIPYDSDCKICKG